MDKLSAFEMDFNNHTAKFESELPLEEEILEIIFIDRNNIFLKLSTKFIKYDLEFQTTHEIKFFTLNNNFKVEISDVTSLYFNEKITFKINNNVYYFGLIASEQGELYISKEINENNEEKDYEITCELIRNFGEKILKLYVNNFINFSLKR